MLLSCFIFATYFFMQGLKNKKLLILSSILFAITPYIYSTATVFMPLLLLLLLFCFKNELKQYLKTFIIAGFVMLILLLPYGINTFFGPLASIGNLSRTNFMPTGLQHLLDPLLEDYPMSVIKKHKTAISFYGDLNYARSLQGGEIIDYYIDLFSKISSQHPNSHSCRKETLTGFSL